MDPIYISLGVDCNIALHLRSKGLRQAAFPFDWIIIPQQSIITFLETKFADWNIRERYQSANICQKPRKKPKCATYVDVKYQIIFFHDFKKSKSTHEKVFEKYEHRIKRLIEILENPVRPVVFVYDYGSEDILKINNDIHDIVDQYNLTWFDLTQLFLPSNLFYDKLKQCIQTTYPNLSFSIINKSELGGEYIYYYPQSMKKVLIEQDKSKSSTTIADN